jgi:hypothetical protein
MMDKRKFFLTSGIVFGFAGVLHLLRALSSWSLAVEGFYLPVGFSYVVAVILLFLSYQGFKLSQKK